MRVVEGVKRVFWLHVESVDVVEIAVPSLGDYGQGPPVAFHVGRAVLDLPCDDGVANHSDAVRVGNHDGTVEESRVVDPRGARHFAVAIESEPCGKDGVVAGLSPGMNGGDAGADWTFADFQF